MATGEGEWGGRLQNLPIVERVDVDFARSLRLVTALGPDTFPLTTRARFEGNLRVLCTADFSFACAGLLAVDHYTPLSIRLPWVIHVVVRITHLQ